jgi:hypothetical protein
VNGMMRSLWKNGNGANLTIGRGPPPENVQLLTAKQIQEGRNEPRQTLGASLHAELSRFAYVLYAMKADLLKSVELWLLAVLLVLTLGAAFCQMGLGGIGLLRRPIPGRACGVSKSRLRVKANPGPTRGGKAGVAPFNVSAWSKLDTELPDYLTPAGRPVKDRFGLCCSMTSARLRSRMRDLGVLLDRGPAPTHRTGRR